MNVSAGSGFGGTRPRDIIGMATAFLLLLALGFLPIMPVFAARSEQAPLLVLVSTQDRP